MTDQPWKKYYVDFLGVWVDNDDAVNRLAESYPKLLEKCPTCETKYDQNYHVHQSAGEYTAVGGEVVRCDCVQQNRLHFMYASAGIGEDYQRVDWNDYQGPELVREEASAYLMLHKGYMREGMGLYFTGPPGTGKTMFANLVSKEFVKMGYRVRVFNFGQLLEKYTAGWKDNAEKNWYEKVVLNSDLLVLDDVGKELSDKLGRSQLDAVLRQRQSNAKPTFITTNLTTSEMQETYEQYVCSLIAGTSIVIQTHGMDFRGIAYQQRMERVKNGWIKPIT